MPTCLAEPRSVGNCGIIPSMAKKHEKNYLREFFDRDYTAKEAYARVWSYARKYKFRIFTGILCGMLTAGTLLPLYQAIQPTLARVESQSVEPKPPELQLEAKPTPAFDSKKVASRDAQRAEKSLEKKFGQLEKWAAKLGFHQIEDDAIGLPLLFIIIVVIPLVALVRLALVFLNHYCLAWAGMRTVRDLRCDILRHVQEQSMQFHGRIDVGQLMTRCTGDPHQVQTIIQMMLQELAQAPFEILISVGFILWSAVQNDMLATLGIIVIGFPMFMVPVVMLSKVIRKWSRRALERSAVVGSRIHEILTCIKAVKSYHAEEYENERYAKANDNTLKATMRTLRWGLAVGPAVETIGIFLICAFIVWCFFTGVKLSAIIPMLAPLLMIYKPLKQLSRLQVQIEQGRAALSRVWSVLDVDMKLPEKANPVRASTFNDKIVFENVSFRYDTAERDAVHEASFEIPRGKVVAVVGGTGSGKSTMSALLARFFDPQGGRITLDGVDLRDLCIADLRHLVGSVQQETLLFNDTIENNIKYGSPDATHEEVVAAAKLANAHDVIMSQPEGYARLAGEKGFALSGGERQRVAIARAILKNPPFLILDEATSALDTVTERIVQEAINNLMKDRTVFAIAHRLSTIRSADLILVMQDGVIVECGTHDELHAAKGVYRKLCDMQHQK